MMTGGSIFHKVDLERMKCSCKKFDMLAISCTHAVAAVVNGKHDVERLVAKEYTTAYWRLAYAGSINPVNPAIVTDVQAGMRLLPPSTCRPTGRPRKA